MMALSSTRLESSFCLIPQPVFIRLDTKSAKNGLQISHWVLVQKQLGEVHGKVDSFTDNPAKASVMVANSQLHDDTDDLDNRLVLLQTGGVIKKDGWRTEMTPPPGGIETGEQSKQDTAESGRVHHLTRRQKTKKKKQKRYLSLRPRHWPIHAGWTLSLSTPEGNSRSRLISSLHLLAWRSNFNQASTATTTPVCGRTHSSLTSCGAAAIQRIIQDLSNGVHLAGPGLRRQRP